MCAVACASSDLSQDVLLPHQFLPLSVGVGGDHGQNVLAVVWHHAHKEDQVLQELRHKPGRQTETLNTISISSMSKPPEVTRGHRVSPHLLSFWTMLPYWSFLTVDSRTLLASLAKSRSLTSDRGTDTMAKASLSSLVGHVPIYWDSKRQFVIFFFKDHCRFILNSRVLQ